MDYDPRIFADELRRELRRDRHDPALRSQHQVGECAFHIADRDEITSFARELDLPEIRVRAEEPEPLLAFARQNLSSLVDDRAFLDDRLEISDIKTHTLVAIIFPAALFWEAFVRELLDAPRR